MAKMIEAGFLKPEDISKAMVKRLVRLYRNQPRRLDDLPYTPEIDEIAVEIGIPERSVWKILVALRKRGQLVRKPRKRKAV